MMHLSGGVGALFFSILLIPYGQAYYVRDFDYADDLRDFILAGGDKQPASLSQEIPETLGRVWKTRGDEKTCSGRMSAFKHSVNQEWWARAGK